MNERGGCSDFIVTGSPSEGEIRHDDDRFPTANPATSKVLVKLANGEETESHDAIDTKKGFLALLRNSRT